MNIASVLWIIGKLAQAAAVGTDVVTTLRAGRRALDIMLDENRNPTDAEWNELIGRIEDRGNRIQNA